MGNACLTPDSLHKRTNECSRWMTLNYSSNNNVTNYILMCSILQYYLCCFCASKASNSKHYCRPKPLPCDHLMGFFRLSTNYQQGLWLPNGCLQETDNLKRQRGATWVRWVGGSNVSSRKSCSWGFSLSSLVSTLQSRHHLASWNATEQGVESAEGGGGGLMAGIWSINSSNYH